MESRTYPNAPEQRRNGPAKLSEPKKIGLYSVGPQQNYLNDFSQLKYIKSTYEGVPISFDLNHNIHLAQKHVSADTKLRFIQLFLRDHRDCLNVLDSSEISLDEVPFVANQGIFREVSYIPSNKNKPPYRITTCLFRGALYISRLWPTEDPANWPKKPEKQALSSCQSHKFEQYMLSDDPTGNPDTEAPVDENSHFGCVFEAYLNKHRLVYAAQMNGLLADGASLGEGFQPHTHSNEDVLEEIKKLPFAKINTNNRIYNRYQENNFRSSKTLNWWLQATYIGVKTILCGIKDEKGIVKIVEHYKTEDLPKDNKKFWGPNRCLNYCDRFLTLVKQSFEKEICENHSGSIGNVRRLPMILLAFEIQSKYAFTQNEFY